MRTSPSPRPTLALAAALLGACASGGARKAPPAAVAASEGRSCQTAVPIDADREAAGAAAVRDWIQKHYPAGKVDHDQIVTCNGKPAQIVFLDTDRGELRLYFDVSKYYGKL